ncbi:MAG: hypothetical protein H0X12_09745, partial [Nocardioides sp.]|nr:hypothetical protein [Nocardioides sp.]
MRRIDPTGGVTTVLTVRDAASVHLSENGRKIVITGVTGGKNQPRTIYSARTGEKLQSRKFDLYPTTVGMKGAKVL